MNETQVKIYGVPGERARTAGTLRVVLPLMAAVLSVGVVAGAGLVLLLPKLPLAVFGGMLLLAAVFLLWTAQMCPGRVTSFFKGARGEERAAFALEGLPEGFCVFHGFARRGLASIWRTDVDHVVLGKTGVFVVETKCWDGEVTCDHGRIWVDGVPPTRDPLAQALRARDELERVLAETQETAVKVRAVLCFAGRGFQGQRALVNGVEICHVRDVAALVGQPGEAPLAPEVAGLVADRLARML